MARLTIGPARLISPFCFLVTLPAMYTAPGAANRNPRKDIMIASRSPSGYILNSAQAPYLCATNL